MKTSPNWGLRIAAALALGLSVPAYANGGGFGGSNGNGGNGGSGGHGGGGGGGSVHSGGSFAHSGGSFTHGGGGGASFVHSSGGGHMISPFIHSQVSAPHTFGTNRPAPAYRGQQPLIDGPNVTISHNPTFPTFAVGGHAPNSRAAQNTQRSFTRPTSGWDRHWDRIWHGRHYHWNNGAWAIINDGYYPYGDSYYYPSSSDVYPDMSYDYGDNSAPNTSVVPAPAPMPAQAESNIASDVQGALQSLSYYHGEIDGVMGDLTRSAIADFQKDNDLPVTGYITKSLLHALGL